MNTHRGKAKFKNFRILLNSGNSSTVQKYVMELKRYAYQATLHPTCNITESRLYIFISQLLYSFSYLGRRLFWSYIISHEHINTYVTHSKWYKYITDWLFSSGELHSHNILVYMSFRWTDLFFFLHLLIEPKSITMSEITCYGIGPLCFTGHITTNFNVLLYIYYIFLDCS